MRNLYKIILLIFPALFFAQTNYYVNKTTGSDTNNGKTISAPFKTIAYAISKATHGDTINIMAGSDGIYTNASYNDGNYWNSDLTVYLNNKNPSSGTSYLTIKPYNTDHIILKGDGDFIVQIRNSSYIIFDGFEIQGEVGNIPLALGLEYQFQYKDENGVLQYRVPPGTPDSVIATMTFPKNITANRPPYFNTIGLLVQGCHHIIIRNNKIHDLPGTGLRAFQSDYFTITQNEIYHNSGRSSSGNHGLVVHSSTSIDTNNGYKIFITKNLVHDNFNEVYSWSELKDFITPHIDEGKGISMQKNTVANGWANGKIKIENNICYGNGYSGVHVNEGIRIDIINNTCYNNTYSSDSPNSNGGISVQDGIDIGVYNNISVTDTNFGYAYSAANDTNVVFNKNLAQGTIKSGINISNTTSANPNFFNAAGNDFHLLSASAAINKSLITYAPTDDYYSKIRDAAPDYGAVEYDANYLATINSEKVKEFSIYPNPSSNFVFVKTENPEKILFITLDGKNITTLVKLVEEKENIYKFDISKLKNATYYMLITKEKSYKFLKK